MRKIFGCYYKKDPERDYLNYRERIDFVLKGDAGIFYTGGSEIPEEIANIIREHIQRAYTNFITIPKIEEQPVIIKEIIYE